MRRTWLILLVLASTLGTAAAAPQWRVLPAAPVSIRIDDIHFLDANRGWASGGEGWISRTTDGGASWTEQYRDESVYFRCIRFAPDALHGWAGGLYTDTLMWSTTNGGATWAPVTNIPEPRPSAICGMWVASSQVVYGVGSFFGPARVMKSTDAGVSWASQDLAPLATSLIDVYFKNPSEGFAVGGVGEFPDSSRSVVMHTTDGGATWQRRYLGTRAGEWGWKISFPAPSIGYVSLEHIESPMVVLKTIDAGLTWTELSFPDYNEQGIGFATPSIGWVGGAGNPTFGTTDGGATWNETPWGEYINRTQFLTPTLGFATGITIYKYSDLTVDVPERVAARPHLEAAPNPFVSGTTIRFTLRAAERVELFIVDPSGRVVRRLVDATWGAGPHTVEWDGLNDRGARVPPGIYLYALRAGGRHEIAKLSRLR